MEDLKFKSEGGPKKTNYRFRHKVTCDLFPTNYSPLTMQANFLEKALA
jgi:hypothetical protein